LGTYNERCLHSLRQRLNDLLQAGRPTKFSSNVNVRLPLRWRHAYRHKYYADVNRF